MRGKTMIAKYRLHADQVREIAQGIYDFDERQRVVRMADEFEKLAVEKFAGGRPAGRRPVALAVPSSLRALRLT
jgi:hypothetical protein